MLMCTCEGTVTGFGLANPKLACEREQARRMLHDQPASRLGPGTALISDKGVAGKDLGDFLTSDDLGLILIRPARADE